MSSTDWGPLAVAENSAGDDARIEGVLDIGDRCVTLDADGETLGLVWPAESTRWSGADRSVELATDQGQAEVFTDGQSVALGGSVSQTRGEDITSAAVTWVAEPDPECQQGRYWFVTGPATP